MSRFDSESFGLQLFQNNELQSKTSIFKLSSWSIQLNHDCNNRIFRAFVKIELRKCIQTIQNDPVEASADSLVVPKHADSKQRNQHPCAAKSKFFLDISTKSKFPPRDTWTGRGDIHFLILGARCARMVRHKKF